MTSHPPCASYPEGVRLFNAGHYWHAHEQWEACWLASRDDTDRRFYKALIQSAAALVKWQQGNLRGLALNWAKSRRHLDELPAHYYGVDLHGLRIAMDQLVDDPTHTPPQV